MDPMTQEANNSSVAVKIFDKTYSLCGPDPGYILKLAEYVDAKMRTLADDDHTADTTCLGVLAALNIADEYLRSKRDGCEAKMPEGGETEMPSEQVRSGRQPSSEPFTEEDRQRTRERRERHHTKRWYEKQLLAIVNDESLPAKERHEALFALGRSRGYDPAPGQEIA